MNYDRIDHLIYNYYYRNFLYLTFTGSKRKIIITTPEYIRNNNAIPQNTHICRKKRKKSSDIHLSVFCICECHCVSYA